jgi:hypothetical protein
MNISAKAAAPPRRLWKTSDVQESSLDGCATRPADRAGAEAGL